MSSLSSYFSNINKKLIVLKNLKEQFDFCFVFAIIKISRGKISAQITIKNPDGEVQPSQISRFLNKLALKLQNFQKNT